MSNHWRATLPATPRHTSDLGSSVTSPRTSLQRRTGDSAIRDVGSGTETGVIRDNSNNESAATGIIRDNCDSESAAENRGRITQRRGTACYRDRRPRTTPQANNSVGA